MNRVYLTLAQMMPLMESDVSSVLDRKVSVPDIALHVTAILPEARLFNEFQIPIPFAKPRTLRESAITLSDHLNRFHYVVNSVFESVKRTPMLAFYQTAIQEMVDRAMVEPVGEPDEADYRTRVVRPISANHEEVEYRPGCFGRAYLDEDGIEVLLFIAPMDAHRTLTLDEWTRLFLPGTTRPSLDTVRDLQHQLNPR